MKQLRDALVECELVLSSVRHDHSNSLPYTVLECAVVRAKQAILTQGWHEITKDGKPPKPGRYLVFADRCQSYVRTYDPERGADFDENISHWTELPDNPKVP